MKREEFVKNRSIEAFNAVDHYTKKGKVYWNK